MSVSISFHFFAQETYVYLNQCFGPPFSTPIRLPREGFHHFSSVDWHLRPEARAALCFLPVLCSNTRCNACNPRGHIRREKPFTSSFSQMVCAARQAVSTGGEQRGAQR